MSDVPDPYALAVRLDGRRVLVVGAGTVATRRLPDLLAAGARVDVVAPEASTEVAGWAAAGRLRLQRRAFRPEDVLEPEPAWLVLTATGAVDAEVAAVAEQHRVWCSRADDAAASAVHRPAVARGAADGPAEGISVAVTAGGDPRRAVAVRDAVLAGLESATLPVRAHRPGGGGPACGKVWLVGAGPGDAGLISVRGRALLAAADVVVADRLGTAEHLADLPPEVEVVDVGKSPGRHGTIQDRIHELLVEHARAGRRVVRLKGGDPFVLGRGGEEVEHCVAAGVEVEVVPGITSATAVPAAAGIPVTHRGVSTSFVVASGHDGAAGLGPLLHAHGSTLVLLMAVAHLAEITAALVAAGRDPATPAAVVERGWTPQQRTTSAPLGELARVAAARGVTNPAVVVVGDVAAVPLAARADDPGDR
ncbi:uroporphyrinogen-III C-methyltransferase [Auraticoccus sp. F435]|uniref:uroporphyrinogen-III C-methyltransferase n=1 Tax=Auraticoccus cholistanensis TaxID=2656650 RepID=A0A6A9UYQ0_9ACTN|nr:uroporphyrinogen-III C-methyltransferase [Auraticoccus cholistanensis]MVA76747.1 uroporphyrinogen-III C-methyltransferase [Auraticoccus cholistanensis]